jgi:hypothetical protein
LLWRERNYSLPNSSKSYIHGMTRAFYVDNLQHNLGKLPVVEYTKVSLKHKQVRIETVVSGGLKL